MCPFPASATWQPLSARVGLEPTNMICAQYIIASPFSLRAYHIEFIDVGNIISTVRRVGFEPTTR